MLHIDQERSVIEGESAGLALLDVLQLICLDGAALVPA